MLGRQIGNGVRIDLDRLSWWGQLKTQLRVGGRQECVPMAKGALARAELGLEGVASTVPSLRGMVDFLNAGRVEAEWRREASNGDNYALHTRERRHYSQNGEDGILEWIFGLVGTTNRFLVEIGASDGEENCTRSLVEAGWSGIWIEADSERARHARHVAAGRLQVIDAPAEPTTIAQMLKQAGAPNDPDLLVLDIDGNDWWVLYAALLAVSPRVLVVEYNSTYRPGRWWVEPYRRGRSWDQSFRHGASLDAMASLAATFGLVLIGCDSTGVNSFYISRETLGACSLSLPAGIQNLYRGPWFAPELWGHSRQRYVRRSTPPVLPLSEAELRQISLKVNRWPTSKVSPLAAGQPTVIQARIRNGTDKLLTSGGGTPFHLALRWRNTDNPPSLWTDEARVEIWPVRPHSSADTRLWSKAPLSPGRYHLELTLVQENVSWLDDNADFIELEVAQ